MCAMDNKYGKVTLERGSVGEDEPVIVFRAQDQLAPNVLRFYYEQCALAGSPPHHLDLIEKTYNSFSDWQKEHPTKVPTSDSMAPGTSG